nr:electron transfer flavoprotein subunit alpha, mitochondrial [Ipomoea batatas]
MATRTMLSAFRNRSLTSRIISHHRSLRTLVLAEHEGGSIKTSSLSAIEAAKSLGDENSISVLLAGSGPSIKEVASQAASCHPSVSKTFDPSGLFCQVLLADSEKFSNPLAEPWAKLVHLVHQKGGYSHIISASSSFGKNILPRAAALLDVSPITDVTEISGPNLFVSSQPRQAKVALKPNLRLGRVSFGDSGAKVAVLAKPVRTVGMQPVHLTISELLACLAVTCLLVHYGCLLLYGRPTYAGNALSTVRYTGSIPCMLTIRAPSFPPVTVAADSKSDAASIDQVDISILNEDGAVGKSRYIKVCSQNTERPDLGNARVVVTGGRALKSAENFKMIEKLAEKLGAAVGATRAAVDAGYVPNDLQVGQTGKIVAPQLYMAFGVSGAIQHIAGMRDSKIIVAVNKDADAPIFQYSNSELKCETQVADYGLVGDLFEVIPELLEKLPEKK